MSTLTAHTIRCSVRVTVLSTAKNGGAEGIRTPDPLLAKQVLSQLSYSPIWHGNSSATPLPAPYGLPRPHAHTSLRQVRLPAFEHRPDARLVLQKLYVDQRVAVHDYQVGEPARLDGADVGFHA